MSEDKSNSCSSSWTVTISNVRGNVQVSAYSNAKWRPKQAKLALYKGSPPSDPSKYDADRWWAPPNNDAPWDTGKTYGPGWSAALIAKDDNSESGGAYFYVCRTDVTEVEEE